jgi:hypothetical protein
MTKHNHVHGEELAVYFVGQYNSDQTEGRGHTVETDAYEDVQDALKSVKGYGGMGTGDGDIVKRTYYRCTECPAIVKEDEPIYFGSLYMKKNMLGRYGSYSDFNPDGWRKDYSSMETDPEWSEYLRLKEKFERS